MLHSWWSAAETTPHFPDRIARRRPLPLHDDQVGVALVANGLPASVTVTLDAPAGYQRAQDARRVGTADAGDQEERDLKVLDAGTGHGLYQSAIDLSFPADQKPTVSITKTDPAKAFSPADLRALHLCLAWQPDPLVERRIGQGSERSRRARAQAQRQPSRAGS